MPFTSEDASVVHYPGTNKAATEEGFERLEPLPADTSNNIGRLTGKTFPTCDDAVEMND